MEIDEETKSIMSNDVNDNIRALSDRYPLFRLAKNMNN